MAETSVSQAAIYRARPTLRLAGQEDARISELLIGLKMEESEGGMSALELRFSNWASTRDGGAELAFDVDSKLKLGAQIEVYAGDESEPREIFRGKITALEVDFKTGAPPEMSVLAEDALQQARLERRSRSIPISRPRISCGRSPGTWGSRRSSPASALRIPRGRSTTKAILLFCADCSPVSMRTCRSSGPSCKCPRAEMSGVGQ